MLKILHGRLQQYMNPELPDISARLQRGRGTRDQIASVHWITGERRGIPEEHLLLPHWLRRGLWLHGSQQTVENPKKEEASDHLMCLPRNLYAGQEATVRTRHGTADLIKIGKGVRLGCILSPCLFNLYAEYVMRNTELDEFQTGIKIARRNINNLRYTDDTTLRA